ncbi:hypothetical protein BH23ACT2_BH23ACT2_27620 [soil metagenome]
MTEPTDPVDPERPTGRRQVPAARAMAVMLVALLLGSLLNAERIDTTARTQPFGWQRTWAVRVTGPLAEVSQATGLHLPRRLLADTAGNELTPPPAETATVETVPPTTAPASTTAPADPAPTTTEDPADPDAPATTAPPSPTTTTPPTTTIPSTLADARTPSADEPVRILVSGDSLMGWVGPALVSELDAEPIDVTEEWEVGSGLARPDLINWPARLEEAMTEHDPEVVVLGFGGNDNQDMDSAEGRVVVGTPEWQAEYQRRVAQVLMAVEAEGRTVYWVGLPVTDRPAIEDVAPLMAEAVQTEVSARPWAHYVDTRPLLAPDGTYTAYLPDESGGRVKVRNDDGVHPNLAGARRMVAPLTLALADERNLG